MEANASIFQPTQKVGADRLLQWSAKTWLSIAILGQLIFAIYVMAYYGGAVIRGDMDAWNQVFPRGYIAGDWRGNLWVVLHIGVAFLISLSGLLQLIPNIRAKAPRFHRWNGRLFIAAVLSASTSGLAMLLDRGAVGGLIQHIGLSLDAMLIIVFALLSLRYALARDFLRHRRWAMRLVMVVSGVWFFRIGLMLWIILNQGPAGFNPKTFEGPFLYFLSFANYLIPLAVLEIYLYAKASNSTFAKASMGIGLMILNVAMLAGIAAATMFMWLPRL